MEIGKFVNMDYGFHRNVEVLDCPYLGLKYKCMKKLIHATHDN